MSPLLLTLLLGTLALPLAGGLWLIGVGAAAGARRTRSVTAIVIVALTTLSSLGLLWLGDLEVPLPAWIPAAGPMSLHIGGLGSELAALTAATLLVSLLLTAPHRQHSTLALQIAALAAANAAFLAGHFLLRYLALEMVGLCIGVAPLLASRGNGLQQAKRTYLSLRLGDAGLLGAILILWHASGTLTIGPAIAAGRQMPPPSGMWAVGGLLLAVWVKSGLWPFHGWQDTATDLPPPAGAWLFGTTMPNLGLYLLYRTAPLIAASPLFLWISVFLALFGLLTVLIVLPRRRGRGPTRPTQVSAIIGAAAVLLAASENTRYLSLLLLITTPLRLGVWLMATAGDRPRLSQEKTRRPAAWVTERQPQGAEGAIIAVAAWSSRRLEKRIAQDGITRLWQLVFAVARWLHLRIETRIAHQGLVRAWNFLTGTAHAWHRVGEEGVATGLVRGTAQSAISISRWLQNLHTGKLRTNQRWTVAALVLAVSLLVIIGW